MAVRIKLDILVLGKTVAELQQMIADLDEENSGPGEGCKPENVDSMDVIGLIYSGHGELDWKYVGDTMEDE